MHTHKAKLWNGGQGMEVEKGGGGGGGGGCTGLPGGGLGGGGGRFEHAYTQSRALS